MLRQIGPIFPPVFFATKKAGINQLVEPACLGANTPLRSLVSSAYLELWF
jgi:hypothetical protein